VTTVTISALFLAELRNIVVFVEDDSEGKNVYEMCIFDVFSMYFHMKSFVIFLIHKCRSVVHCQQFAK
jgi:hypothetical protein